MILVVFVVVVGPVAVIVVVGVEREPLRGQQRDHTSWLANQRRGTAVAREGARHPGQLQQYAVVDGPTLPSSPQNPSTTSRKKENTTTSPLRAPSNSSATWGVLQDRARPPKM